MGLPLKDLPLAGFPLKGLPLKDLPLKDLPRGVQPQVSREDPRYETDLRNPLRRLGFYFAVAFIFMRFSMLHELLERSFAVNYLVISLGAPCVVLMIITGGIRRTMQSRTAWFWTAFMFWLILTVPFSEWKGGSLVTVMGYGRTSFILLPMIAGLVMTWKECRVLVYAVALGGVVNVLTGEFMGSEQYGRLALALKNGSIANANDLAAHLLLVLAFVLYVFWASGRNVVLRFGSLAILLLGFWEIASAGSRGALVAVLVAVLFALVRAPVSVRVATLAVAPVLLAVFVLMLPRETLTRYATLFDDHAKVLDEGAESSSRARTYLFETGLLYTVEHPLLGVGPGEFADFEARNAAEAGRHAAWSTPHNAYAQISSEAGIPALIFLIGGLVVPFRVLTRVNKRAREASRFRDVEMVSYFMQLGMVAFCTACFFLPFAYHFYLPAISGLAVVIGAAAEQEFKKPAPATMPAGSAVPALRRF